MNPLHELLPRRGRGRPPLPSGPDQAPPIGAKLAAAREALAALEPAFAQALLEQHAGDAGGDRVAELRAQRAKLEMEVADLAVAHGAALAADKARHAESLRGLRRTQYHALKRHVEARGKAAAQLTALLSQLAEAWSAFYTESRETYLAAQRLGLTPDQRVYANPVLGRAVQNESYRIGGVRQDASIPDGQGRSPPLPGALPVNGIDLAPSKCPALVETVARQDAHLLGLAEQKVAAG